MTNSKYNKAAGSFIRLLQNMTRVGVMARDAAFLWHAFTVTRRERIFPSPLGDLEGKVIFRCALLITIEEKRTRTMDKGS